MEMVVVVGVVGVRQLVACLCGGKLSDQGCSCVCLFVCLFAGHHSCAVFATATHSCSLDDNNLGPEGAELRLK